MEAKKEFIARRANQLVTSKNKLHAQKLVEELNLNGHLTSYKSSFKGGRGVYTLIDKTYDSLVAENRQSEANDVANAFVNAYGHPAWENKR